MGMGPNRARRARVSCQQEVHTEDWSARQYLRFEAERTQPAIDLLNRVPQGSRSLIADLGCGSGNSTRLLVERFPASETVGIDTSPDMLAAAREKLPSVRFLQESVQNWGAAAPMDLIFANAVMQWVPHHLNVMADLLGQLAPDGCLAVQMPDNFNEPPHASMREVASRPAFRDKLAKAAARREEIGAFSDYFERLTPLCERVDIWRTTYVHRLAGPGAIVEWVKATGLRPFLEPLSATEQETFLTLYAEEVARAYPPLANGDVLPPFPRLFVIAVRQRG